MSKAANLAYLKTLTDRLESIPMAIAKRTAQLTFIEAVNKTPVDSGQAAANWELVSYQGTSSHGAASQKMMWGYDDVVPIAPVGYKTYYEGYDYRMNDNNGDPGDDQAIMSWQMSRASVILASLLKGATGFVIYNPITPGFAGFSPGKDTYYFDNSLSQIKLMEIAVKSMGQAEAEVRTELQTNKGVLQ